MSRIPPNSLHPAHPTFGGHFAHGAPMSAEDQFLQYKKQLHHQLITNMDRAAIGTMSEEEMRLEVRRAAEELCRLSSDLLSLSERERLVNEVLDETFGLGPLEPLFQDPTITDIMINGPKTVYVERNGQLEMADITFIDNKHLVQIVQRIVSRVGRRVDETTPMVDARLPDGSRVNAIIPPLALDGALVSIRRFGSKPLTIKDLLDKKSITPEMVHFLSACINAEVNVLISGGTGSGKTTLLNILSSYIAHDERIATIESAAELQLQQPHVVRMEIRPPNLEGQGEVTTRDLVRNALRMRPDRIIVGECRGPEALDMLQAMNTGHDGSMTTLHANDTRDALSRLEMMVGMAGFDLPIWIIRRQITSAIQIVIQVARLHGGVRRVTKISEVTGMEGDVITMHDLYGFKQTGVDENHVAQGHYFCAGIRPQCLEQLEAAGIRLPPEMFERRILAEAGSRPTFRSEVGPRGTAFRQEPAARPPARR
jgi:pilus assembly protein CpaF